MEFRTSDGKHSSVLLPRRSLLVMSGESRYKWTHGITPRKLDVVSDQDVASGESGVASQKENLTLLHRDTRTSFTFRKIRQLPCDCSKKHPLLFIVYMIIRLSYPTFFYF